MAGLWTKLTVTGKTEDLDGITAVMSMLDNGLMIEDYSDFSFSGMYGELVDDSILNADKNTVKVSLSIAPLDASLYDHPLTLEVARPWKSAKVVDSSGERTVQAVGGRLLVTMKPGDATIRRR